VPLEPRLLELRNQFLDSGSRPLYTLTVAEARAADLATIKGAEGPPEPVAGVIETTVPGPGGPIPVRVHLPAAPGPLPVLVYLFGGGWVLGSLETSDGTCRRLANRVGCATVSVGYRLAPEHKFPAALLDCQTVLRWVAAADGLQTAVGPDTTLDRSRVAVAGDSAGGNLAAALSLLARDEGGPQICAQVLVYPNTDHEADTASMRENTDPAFFNRRSVAWYWGHYLGRTEDGASPLASPARADDLSGLPPALVVTAEYDPLRDEGEHYARRLARAGVEVEVERYGGMVHGFFTMTGRFEASVRAVERVSAYLRRSFGAPVPPAGERP
jgi:acetyl esterase